MGLIHIPTLTNANANARNGMYPSAYLWRRLVDAENHITAYRHRTVYARGWELGQNTGGTTATTTIARLRFRTGCGVSQVGVMLVMGLTTASGGAGSTANPYAEFDLTISGGATTTLTPFAYGVSPSATPTDAPDELNPNLVKYAAVSENTVYECAIRTVDHARIVAALVWELGTTTVVETTNYMNTHSPVAGSPIYDADRERLLVGLSNQHTRNGGICQHWSLLDGTARTRSSATFINLVDNTTTGTPTAAHHGFYLDCQYHNRRRATTVPFELGVYGSVSGGAGGTVRLIDTAGNTYCSVSVTGAAGWYTATGNLPTAETFYALQFAGDGANTLSVYGTSLIETG